MVRATTPATTGATTPAQKIRIYRYIKIDRGDVFSMQKHRITHRAKAS